VAQLLANNDSTSFVGLSLETDEQQLYRQLIIPEIMLLNTIGELAGIFELADVVFVGGSLCRRVGITCWNRCTGVSQLSSGHSWKTSVISQECSSRRVQPCRSGMQTELAQSAIQLLGDTTLQREISSKGEATVADRSGVTERVLEQIDRLL